MISFDGGSLQHWVASSTVSPRLNVDGQTTTRGFVNRRDYLHFCCFLSCFHPITRCGWARGLHLDQLLPLPFFSQITSDAITRCQGLGANII
ncbi:hypothetical protein PAXRUDRAFT_284583 [Paxillus rubicundulus Ve08.2h10]|uniref:Uncharacterized protein n=1 Tax=Paxillus rubicundulus Ve08.2h10 TaxID=930991 RepID=A0A0D0CV12_9AGAM|nr:hypothetical protein PAXRUDRAFT_284583 [Paxillus rubicundulus Ve08.2h10]